MEGFIVSSISKTIMLVIIVLLVTISVVIIVMNERVAEMMGVMSPIAEQNMMKSRCLDACSKWCIDNTGKRGIEWEELTAKISNTEIDCRQVMSDALGDDTPMCYCSFTVTG